MQEYTCRRASPYTYNASKHPYDTLSGPKPNANGEGYNIALPIIPVQLPAQVPTIKVNQYNAIDMGQIDLHRRGDAHPTLDAVSAPLNSRAFEQAEQSEANAVIKLYLLS